MTSLEIRNNPSRPKFGAGYTDEPSGLRMVGYHPVTHPQQWATYVAGASEEYHSRGLGTGLTRELGVGDGVSLFFLVYSGDEVVGGIRYVGPAETLSDLNAVYEMEEAHDITEVRAKLSEWMKDGVVEAKGMWSRGLRMGTGVALSGLFIRQFVPVLEWLGAERMVTTSAKRLLRYAEYTGAEMLSQDAVPFPDARYETISVVFHVTRSEEISHPDNAAGIRKDREQLMSSAIEPGQAWRALVMDEATLAGRSLLGIVVVGATVIDHYEAMRSQLEGLAGDPRGLTEGPRWVYYPWRNTLVRILGPVGYQELRTNRNRNKITRAEQDHLASMHVGVVGASAGHVVAHTLALEGLAGELRLADFDDLELSNLNRIPATTLDLGLNKTVVLARRIAEVDPYLKVRIYPEGITKENLDQFLDGLDLVVEECDSLDVKMRVRDGAKARRIPVIMETSDRGVLDVERFDLEPDRPVFHGRLGATTADELEALSLAERGPYVARLVGAAEASARGVASLIELGSSITGWPQLGSEVVLGGASVAAAVRRFGTGGQLNSGRVRVDIEEHLSNITGGEFTLGRLGGLDLPIPEDPEIDSDDPMTLIADAARRAPSGGNVQPWRFVASGNRLELYLDGEHSKSAMDVGQRGSLVGIGAGLLNARAKAAQLGVLGPWRIFPEGVHSDLVATFELDSESDGELGRLGPLVTARTTNRRNGSREDLSEGAIEALRRAVTREGGHLHLATSEQERLEVGKLLGEADRRRFLLSRVYTEMMAELRWPGRDDLTMGLDVRTLEMGASSLAMIEMLERGDVMDELGAWRAGKMLGVQTQMALAHSSAVAMISVPRDGRRGFVRGGMALERFWLAATGLGIAVQPSAPVYVYANDEHELIELGGERHVDELYRQREALRRWWGMGTEDMIMVLRLFVAEAPSVRSIRRPLEAVLQRR